MVQERDLLVDLIIIYALAPYQPFPLAITSLFSLRPLPCSFMKSHM
jgi:hypothetical protein